jgi:hypothetical protein
MDDIFVIRLQEIAPHFDAAAFGRAVDESPLSATLKHNLKAQVHPDATFYFSATEPARFLSGIMGNLTSPYVGTTAESLPQRPLPGTEKIWQEVWAETLDTYKEEITAYKQAIPPEQLRYGAAGEASYPDSVPPLGMLNRLGINASISHPQAPKDTSAPTDYVRAAVSSHFMTKLTPEEQRAVFFHEAQHAMEPVLTGQTPVEYRKAHVAQKNHQYKYTQSMERRADAFSVNMGQADALNSALEKMAQEQHEVATHRKLVQGMLAKTGFSLDAAATYKLCEAHIIEQHRLSPSTQPVPELNVIAEKISDTTRTLNHEIKSVGHTKGVGEVIHQLQAALRAGKTSHPKLDDRQQNLYNRQTLNELGLLSPRNLPAVVKPPSQHNR